MCNRSNLALGCKTSANGANMVYTNKRALQVPFGVSCFQSNIITCLQKFHHVTFKQLYTRFQQKGKRINSPSQSTSVFGRETLTLPREPFDEGIDIKYVDKSIKVFSCN